MKKLQLHAMKRFVRPLSFGALAGLLFCILLLLLMAVILRTQDFSQMVVYILTLLALIAGGFFAGFLGAALSKERGMLLGLGCGLLLFFILWLASQLILSTPISGTGISKLAAVAFSGAIGGVLSVNRRKKFP